MAWDDVYYWLPSGWYWTYMETIPGVIEFRGATPFLTSLAFGCIVHAIRTLFHIVVALPLANVLRVNKSTAGFAQDAYNIAYGGLPENKHNKRLWRFVDTAWRAGFYAVSFSYGCSYIFDKIWWHDFMNCWLYWPWHEFHADVAFHYAFESGYYWSALAVAISEYKRKDFVINVVHHLLTLTLLGLSWKLNFMRVGSLLLVIHDVADIVIESSKCTKYAKSIPEWVTNVGFASFSFIWLVSRLMIYPKLIYSAIFEGPLLVASIHWPVMIVVLYTMLILLQVLHLVWTAVIVRSFMAAFGAKGTVQDVRSDSEDSDSESDQDTKKKKS